MRKGKKMLGLITILALMATLLSAGPAAAETTLYKGKPAKYIFFFIGDGLGFPQKTAAENFQGRMLVMDQFPAQGVTTTYAKNRFITGSAAASTALGCGQKTNINFIGEDPEHKAVKSVARLAKEKGMKVGVVSSVSIDHATPAAFYAHTPHRGNYHEIDHQLAESGFDFFGGGGLKDPAGKRKGVTPKGDALEKAKKNGYKVVNNRRDFMALTPADGKILAYNEWLQDSGALPYTLDQRKDKDISLPEFTAKAIEMLDNEKGFFLMVEGGKIDWACHANDAASAITNTLDFDNAVKAALDFAKKHPEETLIVVTGDHECGGLAIGWAGTKYATYFDVLGAQKVSYVKFDQEVLKDFKGSFGEIKPLITANFGLKFEGDPKADHMVLSEYEVQQLEKAFERTMAGKEEKSDSEEDFVLYGGYNPLTVKITHILNQKAGLGWTSFKHTGVPVGTMAYGVGAETFNGYYDNTDVALKIMAVMGLEPKVYFVAGN